MSRKVMSAILAHPEVRPLLSDEHFSVDGTLIKAWAATKSFQLKPDTAPLAKDDPGAHLRHPSKTPRSQISPDRPRHSRCPTAPAATATPR